MVAGLRFRWAPPAASSGAFAFDFEGRGDVLSLGAYPEVSLASARQKRDQARKLVAEGLDPSQKRKEDQAASLTESKNTFGVIVKEFLAKKAEEGASKSTLDKNHWLLEDLASPLAERPVRLITAAELLPLLQKIEKSGRKETAQRLPHHRKRFPLRDCNAESRRRPDVCLARGAYRADRQTSSRHHR